MNVNSLGILLPYKKWKGLLNQKTYSELKEYVLKGEEENIPILFFYLESVDIKSLTCDAIQMVDGRRVRQKQIKLPPVLYNPQRIVKKKNILLWRSLCDLKKHHIINEHHWFRNDLLFEMLKVHPEYRDNIGHNDRLESNLFFSLNQRNENKEWQITASYAQGVNQTAYGWEEMIDNHYVDFSQDHKKMMISTLRETNRSILQYLSIYLPGIDEIAIIFKLDASGKPYFYGMTTKRNILNHLFHWNRSLWQQVLHYPISRVANILLRQTEIKDLNNEVLIHALKNNISDLHQRRVVNHSEDIVWVKLKEFESNDPLIRMPPSLITSPPSQGLRVQFGIKKQEVILEEDMELGLDHASTFDTPMTIYLSSYLVKELRLTLEITYQLKYEEDTIVIGPTIGLLLGEKNQIYKPEYMQKYNDRFGSYNRIGGLIIAFSPRSVDFEAELVYGLIYNSDQKKWVYGVAPIPEAIYRRNFHQEETSIYRLMAKTKNRLFNSQRFTKLDLYHLQNEPTIKEHLPETHLLTEYKSLLAFLDKKQKTILKPVDKSRGRGILILEQVEKPKKGYLVHDCRSRQVMIHYFKTADALWEMLNRSDLFTGDYLYQDYIGLMKVNDRPFDVRVVMQQTESLQWQCTGMECRVAAHGTQITNVSRGGSAITLEHALEQSGKFLTSEEIKQQILSLSEQFCLLMDRKGHFSEFGIDIGLDKMGYPWLIEANVFPSFKGFKRMNHNMYLNIRHQPLLYATALQGFSSSKEEINDDLSH